MVTEKSRTEYSARNTTVAMTARVLAILMGFLTRVVFTHTLSEDYVGVNGLFTDILNVLSLSELGVGTAITYALYKPIAEKNYEKQKSLMSMYRRFYRVVAGIVLTAGLMVIPFMDVLIKNQPQVEHLIFIYLMYLLNSVLSYLLVYKRTLIDAHQLSYIGVVYQTSFLILQYVLQMAVLFFTRNFILYVTIMIACTIITNVAVSRKADSMYPYLKEKRVKELPKEEKQDIYQNIRAALMHKVGNVVVSNTDNLLLSALVGIVSVSRYSNYFLIIGSVRQVLNQMFQGITASVGNLNVKEGKERIRKIFEASFFMGQWMFGLAAICLYQVIDPFVQISFGENYVFTKEVTFILCLNFYLTGMRQATLVFRDSMGLFRYDRYKSLAEAIINLMVSLVLGKYLGTLGIFLGTLISTVTTSLWVEPYMLYKHRLEVPVWSYFRRFLIYFTVTMLAGGLTDALCRPVTGNLWGICFLRIVLCFAIVNLIYLLVYHRTKEFRLLLRKGWELLSKRWPILKQKQYEHGEKMGVLETYLLLLLKDVLSSQKKTEEEEVLVAPRHLNWDLLVEMSGKHGVTSLLYGNKSLASASEKVQEKVERESGKIVLRSYRLLFLSRFLINKLEEADIRVVILKGVGTASYYPEPELRKSGDVDILLLEPEKLKQACSLLQQNGCAVKERQIALHHVVLHSPDGVEIELHTMLVEPFDNNRINTYLENKIPDCARNVVRTEIMGVELPVFAPGYHAYELLLHMLQHFLRSGFGLKLLCDWVVLWNHKIAEEERDKYLSLVKESGLKGFSDMVTAACCDYLGLRREQVEWMELPEIEVSEFMQEILGAEEFGKSSKDRMVVLRKEGIWEYIREFHHQMHLNFPKAGKYFVCWPILWVITLVRFLHNNRRIRRVSARQVFRKAGQRSRVIEQARLWQ